MEEDGADNKVDWVERLTVTAAARAVSEVVQVLMTATDPVVEAEVTVNNPVAEAEVMVGQLVDLVATVAPLATLVVAATMIPALAPVEANP